ncbi:hypothetical protein Patl1_13874 [Pistacia atlantica]|uniref:Uncharacterized protein n=1 Tax=Pistacia atlantica TaxID=434234 RepID=A0ACC1AVS1_9ROSI|nr:hypothetical protein Patl1_13874 [Pistacia atlantica]
MKQFIKELLFEQDLMCCIMIVTVLSTLLRTLLSMLDQNILM